MALPSQQEDCGTADALRRVHDKITAKTIFVLSCDLFSDFHVHQLMDLHRIHGSSVTSLFSKNSLDLKKIKIPGPQAKVKKERDFIGIDMLKVCNSFLSNSLLKSVFSESSTFSKTIFEFLRVGT